MMIPPGVVILARDRGPVVCGALSRARLDLHPVVPGQRERRAVHLGRGRRPAPRRSGSTCRSSSATRSRWSLLLPCAAIAAWKSAHPASRPLLWCWIAAIVGFFSLSAGKQDLYIFPIVPAVAALGGLAIERGLSDERWRDVAVARRSRVAGALLALAGGAVLYLFRGRRARLRAGLGVDRRRRSALAGGLSCSLFFGVARPARRRAGARRRDDRRQLGVRRPACCRSSSATSRCPNSAACCRSACSPGTPSRTTRSRCRAWSSYLRRHVDQVRRRSAVRAGDPVGPAASTRSCRRTTTRRWRRRSAPGRA